MPQPNHKIYQLLRSLSETELDEFAGAVSYRHPAMVPLLNQILRYAPAFQHEDLQPSKLLTMLEGAEKLKTRYITDQLSRLARLAEEFLMRDYLRKEEGMRMVILNEALLNRGLSDLHQKHFKQSLRHLQEGPFVSWYHTLHLHQLHHTTYGHRLAISLYNNVRRSEIATQNMHHLDRYYLLTKLILFIDKLQRQIRRNEVHSYPMLNQILSWARLEAAHDPLIRFCLTLLELRRTPTPLRTDMEDAIEQFKDIYADMSIEGREFGFSILMSLLNERIRYFNDPYEKLVFNLNRFPIDQGLLKQRNHIDPTTFIGILISATVIEELEWAEKFVEEYHQKIETSIREQVTALAWSYIDLRANRPMDLLNRLYNLNFRNEALRERSYSLILRAMFLAYIQGNYSEASLESRIKSTMQVFREDKHNRRILPGYRRLVSAIRAMAAYHRQRQIGNPTSKKKLREKLDSLKPLTARQWVFQQFESLPE